jgi:hypothetical protein
MSLNLIKRNSGSPFHLQRSMVDQGGAGDAYESGGYTGESQYSDGGMSEAIAGFGKVVGAAIGSRTASDKNDANVKKETRLKEREKKIDKKTADAFDKGDNEKVNKLMKRYDRVDTRLKDTKSEINKYNESQKPTLKSDIATDTKAKPVESSSTAKVAEGRKESVITNAAGTSNLIDPNKKQDKNAWSSLLSKFKI